MRLVFFFILMVAFPRIYADDVVNYLQEYGRTGVSNYSIEQGIIRNSDLESLLKRLNPFYGDTLSRIRQKAYYLTYKKAIQSKGDRAMATYILLNGANDKDGSIVGQNLEFLKNFQLADFNEEFERLLDLKLSNHRISHYKDFVLLAGFIGTGKDILYQKILDQNVSTKTKWYVSLALARMGNAEQIASCMDKVRKLPINDNLLDYIIPDLIYMRQKASIDYCINILNSKEKLCHSLNPDISESVLCGYRVLEALSPVIIDIPVALDATGNLNTDNYEGLLNEVIKWFQDNPDYGIKKDVY